MKILPRGQLGWRFDREDHGALQARGTDSQLLLKQLADKYPPFNATADPLGVFDILDQGQQGACQGHSLAACFSICYFLATGRKAAFSRACGYYKAQEKDGIRGDSGSTLSGGQWVATQHGMCLESEWPYPSRYNPREPSGVSYRFKLASSTPMKSAGEILKWLAAGLPVQTGIMWGSSMDREVVTDFRPGRGGHSTCLWQLRENGNVVNLNSWGKGWNGDGVHEFTPGALEQMLRAKWSEFVGYAPDGFTYPIEEPIV